MDSYKHEGKCFLKVLFVFSTSYSRLIQSPEGKNWWSLKEIQCACSSQKKRRFEPILFTQPTKNQSNFFLCVATGFLGWEACPMVQKAPTPHRRFFHHFPPGSAHRWGFGHHSLASPTLGESLAMGSKYHVPRWSELVPWLAKNWWWPAWAIAMH